MALREDLGLGLKDFLATTNWNGIITKYKDVNGLFPSPVYYICSFSNSIMMVKERGGDFEHSEGPFKLNVSVGHVDNLVSC